MCQDPFHRIRSYLTLRRLLILCLYFAVLFKLIIPLIKIAGHTKTGSVLLSVVLSSFPLLALLVAIIERPGPLKNWAVSLLILLIYPALVLLHDCTVLFAYLDSGKPPLLWPTLLLNAVVLSSTLFYLGSTVPSPCPGCRRRALVPLMRIFNQEKRSARTFWCAFCGSKYWKDKEGTWQIEHRRTWIDEPKALPPTIEPGTAHAGGALARRRPTALVDKPPVPPGSTTQLSS